MLAVTAGAFLLVTWVAIKALFFFLQAISNPLENRLAKACPCFERLSRFLMFDDAALVLEEIAPEDKNRNESSAHV